MAYADSILAEPPLTSYWRQNDTSSTSVDSKGTNNGTYTGSPAQSQPGLVLDGGGSGSSILYGATSYMATSGTWLNTQTSASLETWMRFEANPSAGYGGWVLGVGNNSAGQVSNSYLETLGITTAGIPTFYVYDGAEKKAEGSLALAVGVAHHLVGTWNGSTAILYADGVQVGTVAVNTGAFVFAQHAIINGDNSSHGGTSSDLRPWAFRCDEVAYYTSVLTPTQVALHYAWGSVLQVNAAPDRDSVTRFGPF